MLLIKMGDLMVKWVIACQSHKKELINHINKGCKLLLTSKGVGIIESKGSNAYHREMPLIWMHN